MDHIEDDYYDDQSDYNHSYDDMGDTGMRQIHETESIRVLSSSSQGSEAGSDQSREGDEPDEHPRVAAHENVKHRPDARRQETKRGDRDDAA